MQDQQPGECPYCGDSHSHLNNHVRMKAGDGHAGRGEYPDTYDTGRQRDVSSSDSHGSDHDPDQQASSSGAAAGEGQADGQDQEPPADAQYNDSDTVQLVVTDNPADARQYNCGNCGERVPYLEPECADCGEDLVWRAAA